jgi:CRISPR-associated protein Cas1
MELVLSTFGTALRVENGIFLVVHPEGKQSINPQKLKRIIISKGASISSDAALLAIEHEIDVIFIDRSGKPSGRVWSIKFGSISNIRRKQLDFLYSPKGFGWVKELVVQKMDNQIGFLLSFDQVNETQKHILQMGIRRIEDYKKKVNDLESQALSDVAPTLRGWEGVASKVYFESIKSFLPQEYRFEERSKHPAMDAFNCLLNYGYGMMYGKVEGTLIKAGIDPYIGVYHRDDFNRPALVFDVIEIFRVWVDYVVVSLCLQQVFDQECFSQKADGSWWLENLGKRILIQSINDYLTEIINLKGFQRSRETHIELYAQNLAQIFLNS